MDPVIEEMMRWRVDEPLRAHVAGRWRTHLRDVVQPQLDELAALKAEIAARKPTTKKETA